MRVASRRHISYTQRGVQLNNHERAILAEASRIASRARERCREIAGVLQWEDEAMDMTLASVEHDAVELSEA
jgi:hypothetical protein